MNIDSFLQHWSINENPYRAEEARHDQVFARLGVGHAQHPDFEKIAGDLARPSTSIVFGEKGSGKTAIRLQIEDRILSHNDKNPGSKVFLVEYDDLNPALDQLCRNSDGSAVHDGAVLQQVLDGMRLVDHIDAMLSAAVPGVVDAVLGDARVGASRDQVWRVLRGSGMGIRNDLRILQAVYDRRQDQWMRGRSLQKRLRSRGGGGRLWWSLAWLGWVVPGAVVAASIYFRDIDWVPQQAWLWAFGATMLLWVLAVCKHTLVDKWKMRRTARRVVRDVRVVDRDVEQLAGVLRMLPEELRGHGVMPSDGVDDIRYEMFARLRRVLAPLGYTGVMVVMDRVDEPTVINGESNRMRAVIWPLLNSKFLQQEGIGFKLLLPIELRHELFRESSSFFQEARLDKQSLIERLSWTGSMLYDLCNARLRACRDTGSEDIALSDLFEQDVNARALIDALDQMHQPRDAFKLLYRCMQEHCASVTDDEPKWRIPRLTLETVRKQESERVQMFFRGIRPA